MKYIFVKYYFNIFIFKRELFLCIDLFAYRIERLLFLTIALTFYEIKLKD